MSAAAKKKKGLSIEEKIVLVEQWMTAHPLPYTMKELQQLIPKQTPVIYQSVEECVLLLVAENRVEQDKVGVSTLFWKFPLTETQKANPARQLMIGQGSGTAASLNMYHHGAGGGSGGAMRGPLAYAELLRRLTSATGVVTPESVERWCAATASADLRAWQRKLIVETATLQQHLAAEYVRVGFTEEEKEEQGLQVELTQIQSLLAQRARLVTQRKALSTLQTLPETLRLLAAATRVAMDAANRWTDNYFLAEMEVVCRSGQSTREVRTALNIPPALDFVSDEDEEEKSAREEPHIAEPAHQSASKVPPTVERQPVLTISREPLPLSGTPDTEAAKETVDVPIAATPPRALSPEVTAKKQTWKTKRAQPPAKATAKRETDEAVAESAAAVPAVGATETDVALNRVAKASPVHDAAEPEKAKEAAASAKKRATRKRAR